MDISMWVSLAIAFAVSVAIAPYTIKKLKRLKIGQKILEDGPTWHMSKQNTPTIGGLIFIIGISTAVIVMFLLGDKSDYQALTMLGISLCFGAIGYVDDYTKVKKKRNKGLSSMQKLMLQIVIAALFVTVMRVMGALTPELYIPFFNVVLPMPWPVYLLLAIFIIVGADNAVNITDGIDGLCSGVTFVVAVFFCGAFTLMGNSSALVFSAATAGGLLAFYLFNKKPARVFMGDTGSLFLGGAVCAMAFALKMPLILVLVGIIYIIETLSDIIQIGYYKLSGGKRVFKMAPIHHHFEMCGWSERKIVAVFSAITAAACILAYWAVTMRYIY